MAVPSWWRHQRETLSTLLAICAGNSPVTGEFPAQRPVARSFDVFFDLRPNKQLSKQWCGWWFDTPSHPLWLHCNATGSEHEKLMSWHTYFLDFSPSPLATILIWWSMVSQHSIFTAFYSALIMWWKSLEKNDLCLICSTFIL